MVNCCTHQVCGKEDRVWLSDTPDKFGSIEQHTWCTECGLVQNRSEDRPKKIGYWMNKLGSICYELGITQAQKRLMAKKIEEEAYFQDSFGSYGSGQQELFIQIISKYCDTSRIDFDEYLSLTEPY